MKTEWNGTLWIVYCSAEYAAAAIQWAKRRPRVEVWIQYDHGQSLIYSEVA